MQLVLSIFPGIDLLGRAFEEVWGDDICVVRGPDVIFGGDIRGWHVPVGRFQGVIGGPPCQPFSELRKLLKACGHDTKAVDRIPEFGRVVTEAKPDWFLMENVKSAYAPPVNGYAVTQYDVRDSDLGGETMRRRRVWFGSRSGSTLQIEKRPRISLLPVERAVTRNARIPDTVAAIKAKRRDGGMLPGQGRYMPIEDVCELQGLPRDLFAICAFSREQLRIMLGNGVPMAMGRALAKAVKEATEGGGT